MAKEQKEDPVIEVRDSLYFGRWVNQKTFSLAFFLAIALTISLAGNFYLVSHRPRPVYFASSSSGKIVPMVPLDRPVRSERWLIEWSASTIEDLLTISAVNYNASFLRIRDKFLPSTFGQIVDTFDKNGMKKYILDNRMDTYVALENAPVIVNEGVMNGQRSWKIQAPIVLTFTNGAGRTPKHFVVEMVVSRVPTFVNKNGVVVSSFALLSGSEVHEK